MLTVADGWARIGRYLRIERKRRRMTQEEFADATGIGRRTLGSLERGEPGNYDHDTRAAIELALRWEPLSVERVLEGRQPVRARDDELARLEAAWADLSPDARYVLVLLAEGALRRLGR